jgi:hypothetical protein
MARPHTVRSLGGGEAEALVAVVEDGFKFQKFIMVEMMYLLS